MALSTPLSILRQQINSSDFCLYKAAYLIGLIPEPWEQTELLGKCFGGKDVKLKPDYRPTPTGAEQEAMARAFANGKHRPTQTRG